MTGTNVIRVLMGVIGAALLIGGIALALGGGLVVLAIWMLFNGSVLVIIAVIEISRYRSEAAENAHFHPGPGGGETIAPESRFKRTDEVFIDPTTQRRMRVFADPATGERRYVSEG
jgi:hypothetical protein